jgi:hypothetical protein
LLFQMSHRRLMMWVLHVAYDFPTVACAHGIGKNC